jgi:hypothetical protein
MPMTGTAMTVSRTQAQILIRRFIPPPRSLVSPRPRRLK